METAAGPTASAAALEPDIQVAPNALGGREASLTGQHLSAPLYLVVTESGAIAVVARRRAHGRLRVETLRGVGSRAPRLLR
jgi:hypothetical protein